MTAVPPTFFPSKNNFSPSSPNLVRYKHLSASFTKAKKKTVQSSVSDVICKEKASERRQGATVRAWWWCVWKLQWECVGMNWYCLNAFPGLRGLQICVFVHVNTRKWRSINFAWVSIKTTLFDPVDCLHVPGGTETVSETVCSFLILQYRFECYSIRVSICAFTFCLASDRASDRASVPLFTSLRFLNNSIAMHGDIFTVCNIGSDTEGWQRWGGVRCSNKNKDFSPSLALILGQGFCTGKAWIV